MEPLQLVGTSASVVHHAIIKAFWDEFGINGNKTYRSPKSKARTLNRLKLIGDMIILRQPNTAKNKLNRAKFDKVKYQRHSLKSHKVCFACGDRAAVRHHIIWIKHGGLNSKRNLISLCTPCHAVIHTWLQPSTK